MEGWIKIYREIENHWIWKNDKYFKCWEWFIMRANHIQNKVLIGTEFIEVNRGEFITSISKICQATGMSMQSTRTFLALLEKDKMINKQTTSKLTKLTICNYDYYQGDQQTNNKRNNKRVTNPQQACNTPVTTDKNEENDNNEKNVKKEEPKADFINRIVNCFIQEHGSYEIIVPGKEREMAGKILGLYKKKYPEANSEETLEGLRTYFKMCVNIPDTWLRNNMSLSIIVSKFNEINKILKNGSNKSSGATDEQLTELLAEKLGISQ